MPLLLLLTAGLAVEPVHAALEVPEDLAPLTGSGRVTAMPQFELQVSGDGQSELVLGINTFTKQQLLQFANALPDFLEGAVNLSEGQSLLRLLTWPCRVATSLSRSCSRWLGPQAVITSRSASTGTMDLNGFTRTSTTVMA